MPRTGGSLAELRRARLLILHVKQARARQHTPGTARSAPLAQRCWFRRRRTASARPTGDSASIRSGWVSMSRRRRAWPTGMVATGRRTCPSTSQCVSPRDRHTRGGREPGGGLVLSGDQNGSSRPGGTGAPGVRCGGLAPPFSLVAHTLRSPRTFCSRTIQRDRTEGYRGRLTRDVPDGAETGRGTTVSLWSTVPFVMPCSMAASRSFAESMRLLSHCGSLSSR